MTETLALTLRVGLSFTFVLGLMWFAARVFRGKLAAKGEGVLEVLARQQVGRGASVAVVRVADRALIVGITEHSVRLLGDPLPDLDRVTIPVVQSSPVALEAGDPARPFAVNGKVVAPVARHGGGAESKLSGSILSPAAWRQVLHLLRERTVRR